MPDSLFVLIQHLMPKRLITELLGKLARYQGGALTHFAIRRFIAKYHVNMDEAADPRPTAYRSFNEFFARPLRSGIRPIANANWVSPVDGALSQAGPIHEGQIFQAKGHYYSTVALLGGDTTESAQFVGGHFATIYLSPKDYHRLHMPQNGVLQKIVYVPGDLYSVNPATVRGVPGLFARNERVICYFINPQTKQHFAMILVAATVVGCIGTVWTDVINQNRVFRTPTDVTPRQSDSQAPFELAQGQEMGRFLLGSTVILLAQSPDNNSPFARCIAGGEGLALQLGQVL
jgi:phosphatidylserine decarboxylase